MEIAPTASGGPYLALEDGSTYMQSEFTTKSQGSALLAAWGFTSSPTYQVHSGGTLLWATQLELPATALPFKYGATVLSHLPVGFSLGLITQQNGPPQLKYDLVADKNLLRVFAEVVIGGENIGLPVLWADRFGHYVTFQWTQVSTGLPAGIGSIVRIDALNQRGQGVTIRYANWNDSKTLHDLMRVDFVKFAAPAALIQGYSGFSNGNPSGFIMPSGSKMAQAALLANAVGGMTARPCTQTLGDPLTVPQPSWNNDGAPAGTAPVLPASNSGVASQVWKFTYDGNLAEITSLTDPLLVQTAFSYGNFSLLRSSSDTVPILLRGVTQTVETDTSQPSPAVRTKTWVRTMATASNPAWTVNAQDTWSSVGSPDSTVIYGYPSLAEDPMDYSNEFLQSQILQDNSGTAWSTLNWQSVRGWGAGPGGGLDGTLSPPSLVSGSLNGHAPFQQQITYTDATDLQVSTVTSQVDTAGGFLTTQTSAFKYNPQWPMLEANQVIQSCITRNAITSAGVTSVAPATATTTYVWDTGTALQLCQSYLSASATLAHGQTFTYDTTQSDPNYGKLLTKAVFHLENASTPSSSPATVILGYDPGTGQPTSWATSYQDYPTGTGTISQLAGSFDGADRPTVITDARNVTTTTAYDLYGRATLVSPLGDSSITSAYPDFRTRTDTRDGMARTVKTDGFGRPISETLPDGSSLTYAYDRHGRLASTTRHGTAGDTLTQSTSYDLLGRVVTATGFDGIQMTSNYAVGASGCSVVTRTLGGSTTVTTMDPFVQTEPNGLIYMRGRFYSPAWHVFLNSDQGVDPNQTNQDAYAGGNPMVNVDPSGMSLLSKFLDPLGEGHSIRINWNHGRKGIEIGVAVVVCIVIDVCSDGTAADTNPEIIGAAEGGTEVVAADGAVAGGTAAASSSALPAYVGYNAAVGFVAGGAIQGTWRGAFEGAIDGVALAFGYDCLSSGIGSMMDGCGFWNGVGNAAGNLASKALSMPLTWTDVGQSAVIGGVVNGAEHGGSPWNNFRDGAIISGASSFLDMNGVFGTNSFGRFVNESYSRLMYGMANGDSHSGSFYFGSPFAFSMAQGWF